MQNSNWEKCKLKSICKNICSGGTPKSTESSFYGGNIPWLRTQEVNFQNIYSTGINITNAGLEHSAAKWVPTNTVIVAMYGNSAGRSAITKIPLTTNQACCCFQIDERQADYRYVFNFLKLSYLQIKVLANGGAQQNLNSLILKNLDISLPPLDEQKRIAEILGSLDDKIELLQKQNKTLEDMAKALFKSWFVDFDVVRAKQKGLPKADIMREYHLTDDLYDLFPSSFADSPLGPIPSGWEVKPLKDLASITAGKRPKQVKDIKDDNFFIPVYGGNGIKWWTNVSLYSTPIIITGRVGTLGKVYRIYEPVWVSDNALIFEVQKEHFEYLLYMLYTIDFNSFNRGSTQPLITQSDIKEILVVFGQDIVQKFHSIIVEYEKKINNNNRQIQTLTELRDSLLPRLISGKIRVLIH